VPKGDTASSPPEGKWLCWNTYGSLFCCHSLIRPPSRAGITAAHLMSLLHIQRTWRCRSFCVCVQLGCWHVISFASIPISRFHPLLLFGDVGVADCDTVVLYLGWEELCRRNKKCVLIFTRVCERCDLRILRAARAFSEPLNVHFRGRRDVICAVLSGD
jgi:hypothetical protein